MFSRRRFRRGDRGYTMVALLILITIMGILMGVAVESWSTVARRDREEELIFRGQQYVTAIRMFQRRHGRLPNQLKELWEVKPRSIRHLWKDPITGSDFDVVPALGGGSLTGSMFGGNPTTGKGDKGEKKDGGPSFGGSEQPTIVGPFIGVCSKSTERSIRIYQGRQRYNDWKFTIMPPGGAQTQVIPPGGSGGIKPPGS